MIYVSYHSLEELSSNMLGYIVSSLYVMFWEQNLYTIPLVINILALKQTNDHWDCKRGGVSKIILELKKCCVCQDNGSSIGNSDSWKTPAENASDKIIDDTM